MSNKKIQDQPENEPSDSTPYGFWTRPRGKLVHGVMVAIIAAPFVALIAFGVNYFLARQITSQKPPAQTEADQQPPRKSEEPRPKRTLHQKKPPFSAQQMSSKPKVVAAFATQSSNVQSKVQETQTPPPTTPRHPKRIIGVKSVVSIGGEPPKDDPDEIIGKSIKVHVPASEIGKYDKIIGEEVNVIVGDPKNKK